MTDFVQWTNSKKIYNIDLEGIDGSHFPVTSKPVWSVIQNCVELPTQSLAVIETPPDCHAARITTGDLTGTIAISVTATTSTGIATAAFIITVKKHPTARGEMKFKVSQHRNGPMH
jgi:hypothetical protein